MNAPHSVPKSARAVTLHVPVRPKFVSAVRDTMQQPDERPGFSATYSLRLRVSDRKLGTPVAVAA